MKKNILLFSLTLSFIQLSFAKEISFGVAYIKTSPSPNFRIWRKGTPVVEGKYTKPMLEVPKLIVYNASKKTVTFFREDSIISSGYEEEKYVGNPIGDGPGDKSVVDAWYTEQNQLQALVEKLDGDNLKCSLFNIPQEGAWKVVKTGQIKSDSEKSCRKFLNEWKVKSISTSDIKLLNDCSTRNPAGFYSSLKADSTNVPKSSVDALLKKEKVDSFLVLDEPSLSKIYLFGVTVEDSPHLSQPVYVSDRKKMDWQKLKLPTSKVIGACRTDHHLLLSSEFEGNDPVVIDLNTSQIVFSDKGTRAVIAP